MNCRTAPLSHPHSKHREKVLLKVLKYKTFSFLPWSLCLFVSQLVMVFFMWHPNVVLSKIKNLNDYHEFYLLLLYCAMPISNANVNIFNSYGKSLKLHNLRFIAPICRCILSYPKRRNTSQNELNCFYFTSWFMHPLPALFAVSLLKSKEGLKGRGTELVCLSFFFWWHRVQPEWLVNMGKCHGEGYGRLLWLLMCFCCSRFFCIWSQFWLRLQAWPLGAVSSPPAQS